MGWFTNLSLRWKLMAAFGAVGAIMAFVGYMGFHTAQGVKTNLDGIAGQDVPSIVAIGKAETNFLRAQRDVRSLVLETDATKSADLQTKIKQDFADADKAYAEYKVFPATSAEKKLITDFETARSAWLPVIDQAIADAAKNTEEDKKAAADTLLVKGAPLANAVNSSLQVLVDENTKQADTARKDATTSYEQALKILVGAIVLGIAIALALAFFLSRSIVATVKAVQAVLTSLAERCATNLASGLTALAGGDLTVQIVPVTKPVAHHGNDEVGQMAATTNVLLAKVQASVDAYERARAELQSMVGQVRDSAETLADASSQLGTASEQTGSAVQEVTNAVQGIARGAGDQAGQVQHASTGAKQVAGGAEQVATGIQNVAAAANQTREAAQEGAAAVRDTVSGMGAINSVVNDAVSKVTDLGKLSEKIGAVVETIDDIAEQTNLLALNATIEAARAGEHGKAFAVVAEAVRKLAERSQRETTAIAALITEVQGGTREAVAAMESGSQQVASGVRQADQAGEALSRILSAVERTATEVSTIAAAAEEMAAQADQVGSAIEGIAAVTEENSAATEEVSASAEEMSAQVEEMTAQAQQLAQTAEQLRQIVARFRLEQADTHPISLRRAA